MTSTARAMAADVRSGRADPVDLVEQALTRLEETAGTRAFVQVDAEGARAQARALRGRADGALLGVPVAVKDLFDVEGQVTAASSDVPPGPPAQRDATAVARLRAAGAVVLGRTRMHEFAWGITTWHPRHGGTRNPWDLGRTAGGSSGGSAAAVAAGVVPIALGTDTACSIRLPAAWCGLVGHKPTHGAVPLDGVVPLAASLDAAGALTLDVDDARLALEVLTGRPLGPAPTSRVAGVRVDGVAGPLADVLAGVPEVQLDVADLPALYAVVQGAEALAWHRSTGRWPAHADAYGDDVRARLARCEDLTAADVEDARRRREDLRDRTARLLTGVDLLLLPVATCGPSRTEAPDESPADGSPLRASVLPWTVLANLCGLPACAVPVGLDADGLPVAVQVVGRPGEDARVLAAAAELARELRS